VYVVGTAGHVDHGKSALDQALPGLDPKVCRMRPMVVVKG